MRFAAFCIAFFFCTSAEAAKFARVDLDKIEVRAGPGENFPVLIELLKSSAVTASNVPIEGYYKVRTSEGLVGFVPADSLLFVDPNKPSLPGTPDVIGELTPQKKDASSKRHRWFMVRLLGGYGFFAPGEVNGLIASTTAALQNGYHFGGELGVRFNERFAAIARLEGLMQQAYAVETGGNTYHWTLVSWPVMVGGEFTLWSNRWFSIPLSVLGGMGPGTSFTSTALQSAGSNQTIYAGLAYGFLAKIGAAVSPVPWLQLGIEGGYRFLRTPSMAPSLIGSGGEVLQVNGQYESISIDLSGPFVGLQLGFQF